jgi:hypothetical protein
MFLLGSVKAYLFGVCMSSFFKCSARAMSQTIAIAKVKLRFRAKNKNNYGPAKWPRLISRGLFFGPLVFALSLSLSLGVAPSGAWADEGGSLDSRMENDRYPIHPHEELTAGSLCDRANQIRYPERIKYCTRSVTSGLKREIIVKYDRTCGYRIGGTPRADFKIDHLIPLCMGGSNHEDNLWPQHKTVYLITDPLEPEFCNKMAQNKISQSEAVELIVYAKHHLDEVAGILARIRAL